VTEKDTIRAVERALLRIVRSLGRRGLGRTMERKLEGLVDFSHVAVVDALGQSEERGESVTVGLIARRVGLDHSRASRMVAAAIRAGYARRVASQEDGRRTCVALTEKGGKFASAIAQQRQKFFATHLKAWPEKDSREFARLLTLFAQGTRHDQAGREDRADPAPSASPNDTVVVLQPEFARRNRKPQHARRA